MRAAVVPTPLQGRMQAPKLLCILNLAYNKSEIERRVHAVIDKFAEHGLRSLSVAYQEVLDGMKESPGGPWYFVALMPLFDLSRHHGAETVRRALNLGVNVKMITGNATNMALLSGWRLAVDGGAGLGIVFSWNSIFRPWDVSTFMEFSWVHSNGIVINN